MNEWRWRIDRAHAGRRVDGVLRAARPDLPYAHAQRLFRKQRVRVNRRPVAPDHRVQAGDVLSILTGQAVHVVPPNPAVRFDVLHEDRHVIVVAKPADVAMHPGKKQRTRTLVSGLLARFDRELRALGEERGYGLTHRLDAGTSGVVVVARTAAAHANLLAQFRRRAVRKDYRALVAGEPARAQGTVHLPLERTERAGRTRIEVGRGGEGLTAVTEYRRLGRFGSASLLGVVPRTGRMHQIRVHLGAIGCPVLGDPLYGRAGTNEWARRRLGLERMFLHAAEITFLHPGTGRALTVTAPLPPELQAVLDRLASAGA
ncbi:MAG: RluA family pseudouridine synthase [Planctomycetes bacterium]|nr:RluA family pseudouridine synthase [Planctomycetota bacterium]